MLESEIHNGMRKIVDILKIFKEIKEIVPKAIKETIETSPSIPSSMLKALHTPTTIKIVTGIP